jgi:mRNA interferase MazF
MTASRYDGSPAFYRGEIVLVTFPFTDLSSSKLRPALIVERVSGDDLILAFITSRTHPSPSPSECLFDSRDPEFHRTGLKLTSIVRLDKLATLHPGLVRRRLGFVDSHVQGRVNMALRYVFAL